jgi:tetratricopeptide (TPR) repeat protein
MTTGVKPLLIFDGNCQAQHLGAMIRGAGVADTIFIGGDFGFLPSYRQRGCRIVTKDQANDVLAAAKSSGATLIQVSQLSPFARQIKALPEIELADKRVFFPEVRLWAISPRRFAEKFKSKIEVERIFELDLQSARTSQEKATFSVDIAAFVEQESKRRPLFHTINHPAGAIFARLLEGLAVTLKDEIDTKDLLAIARDIEDQEGLNFETNHPVSAHVREKLHWEWGPEYDLYAQMLTATREKNWTSLERDRNIYEQSFSEDTQFWRSYALLGRALKSEPIALPAFERLLELCPGVPGGWLLYAEFLEKLGRGEDILTMLARAEEFFEGSNRYHGLAAKIQMRLRDFAKAETHAREFWHRSSDTIQAAFPLLQILIRRKEFVELDSIVASLRERPANEVSKLDRFLSKIAAGRAVISPAT